MKKYADNPCGEQNLIGLHSVICERKKAWSRPISFILLALEYDSHKFNDESGNRYDSRSYRRVVVLYCREGKDKS